MDLLWLLLICVFGPVTFQPGVSAGEPDIPPVINITAGLIRGKYINLSDGGRVIAYLGVPYALPPVGSLRFKPPEPVPRWTDVYNATEFGPLCVQSKSRSHWDIIMAPDTKKRVLKRLGLFDYPQGEDCLNLNIYVPWPLPESHDERGLSVMVYFHGGSYKTNGGRFYPGEWLANAGKVIVITMNYRLGVLGFLSTQDKSARGNYGLLDQVLALKWLRENLEELGGNIDDITIFGNSAGGSCVGLHLMSPLSRGLFSKAIAQSGSPLGEWAFQKRPRIYAEQLAAKFNCPDVQTSSGVVGCLMNISAYEIVEKSEDAKTLEDSLMLQFAPVVDGKFLPKHPMDLLRQEGALVQVPIMVGLTRDELEVWMTKSYQERDPSSIPFTKDLLRKYLLHLIRKESLSEQTLDVLLHAVYTEYVYRQSASSPHHSKKMLLHILNNATVVLEEKSSSALPDIRTLGKIISDIDLKAPAVKFLQLLAMHPNMSIYMYEFDYASTDDVIVNKYGGGNNAWVGSYHESELYYLFGFPHLNLQNALRLREDKQISDMMIQLWTDFAKYGDPTPEDGRKVPGLWNFTWKQYTEEEECFASLSLHPFVARSYEKERMVFWNHFVPLLTDYPISWSAMKSKPKSITKLLEECHFEIILALTFLGWATFILLLGIILHTCLCRTISAIKMKNIPIPI